jgi:ADP-ribose pyrophosphatase YjhB (NUDIX family)
MPTNNKNEYNWLELAQKLQSIAQAGLTFTEGKYDLERYRELLHISATIVSEFATVPVKRVESLYSLEHGYLTPKVDIRGVVFENNQILMVKETADGRWSLPGGWADVGLSPFEVAVKEIREESGLYTIPKRLLAVLDKKKHNHPADIYYCYKMFILCERTGGSFSDSIETSDSGFFSREDLPELSRERITAEQIQLLFQYLDNPEKEVICD